MKSLCAAMVLGVGTMVLGGCFAAQSGFATPAYSGHERGQMIGRNQNYEWRQAQDDIDTVMLLRPASSLTMWHVN